MPIKQYLLTPGPTPVPERVMLAMARPSSTTAPPTSSDIFREAAEGLQWIFQTKQPVLMLSGSGTLAMEAAVVNTMKRGDKALCVVGGKFGERWRNICKALRHRVRVSLDVEWGTRRRPRRRREGARRRRQDHRRLLAGQRVVDGRAPPGRGHRAHHGRRASASSTSSTPCRALGAFDLPMDAAGFDVLLTGSQKALMLPPGQAYIALSDKAWARTESADLPRFYSDLKREKKAQAGGETAWTPAITLTVGLVEALRMIKEEGLAAMFRSSRAAGRGDAPGLRRARLRAVRARRAVADGDRRSAAPKGFDTGKLVKQLRDRYGVSITGGQDAVKGKIFRVAHLGLLRHLRHPHHRCRPSRWRSRTWV